MQAFINSYHHQKTGNHFTKVKLSLDADRAIQSYFNENLLEIEKWFNVITSQNIQQLKRDLKLLSSKKWRKIIL